MIGLLDQLNSNDQFNIIAYSAGVSRWQSSLQNVTPSGISAAKTFITNLVAWRITLFDLALSESFKHFSDTLGQNIILNFTNGKSLADPKVIKNLNTKKQESSALPLAMM